MAEFYLPTPTCARLTFAQIGRIHVAAFTDEVLYNEVLAKAYFWMQPSFYGVDVTSLQPDAVDSYFSQVVLCVVISYII